MTRGQRRAHLWAWVLIGIASAGVFALSMGSRAASNAAAGARP